MEVVYQSARAIGAPLRKRVEARLRFMLRHLSWFVARAIVRLSEKGGANEASGKHCAVELSAADGTKVVVNATARDWLESIDDALRRAARLLARHHRQAQQG